MVTPAEQNQWLRDGYFVRKGLFTGSELSEFRQASDQASADIHARAAGGRTYFLDGNRFVDVDHITLQYEHQPSTSSLRVVEPVHELHDAFLRLIADERLVAPMRELVGADRVGLWTAKLNLKPAFMGSGFGWHQDSPYWLHAHAQVDRLPNVFVAFDDAHATNGGLRLIRGSHKRGPLPGRADGSQLEGFYTHSNEIDETQIVTPELPAGSLLFFSPHIIHGSGPNNSADQRRALIATYQDAGLPELKSGRVGAAF